MVDAPGQFLASLKNQAEQVKQKIVPSGTSSPSCGTKEEAEEKWVLSFRNALDEIFNLYARGKWFRRQFLQLCTTILQNAFFAGKVNLRMKELIGEFTEDNEVATYIDKIRVSLFPEVLTIFENMSLHFFYYGLYNICGGTSSIMKGIHFPV